MLKQQNNAMKILVTGGAGYIGSILTRELLQKKHAVTVFDNLQFGGESVIDLLQYKRFQLIHGDVRNKKQVHFALKNVDCVVHLAALVGEPACKINPKATEEINYKGAKILCDEAKNAGVKRFIHISTCSNYGISDLNHPATEEAELHPISLYAKTKIAAEKYVIRQASKGFAVCVLRLATVYGISPRMRFDLFANEVVRDAFLTKRVAIYQPFAFRPFVHVSDVARAIITCIKAPENKINGQVFNVVNKNYQKQDIVKLAKNNIPSCKIEILDSPADKRDYNVSSEKIKKVLGFQAKTNLDTGIKEMLTVLKLGIFKDPNSYRYTNIGWPSI